MEYRLSLNKLPIWEYSTFRYFEQHEHHVTRIYAWDVLVLVFEGVLRFNEAGVPIEVHAGEYYIQRHGLFQEGLIESDTPKYYLIHWKCCEYTTGDEGLPIRGKWDCAELFPLFHELDTLRIINAPLVEKSAVFYKILSLLRKSSDYTGHGEVVAKVVSYVTKDIRKPFSLDDAAANCGYSKNQIISIFKRESGKTPYAYIIDLKLDMAKRLLLVSTSSLSSISAECGFGSYINFYRAFFKAEGCSPSDWRKEH